MEAGNYNNVVRFYRVKNAIWKPAQHSPSNIPVDYGESVGVGGDDSLHILDSFEKLFAEPEPFPLVPAICGPDLRLGG
jgi:hypothetical protein